MRRGGGATCHLFVPGLSLGRHFFFGDGWQLLFSAGLIPLLVIDEQVDASNPQISGGLVISSKFIDALLGDKFEL